MTLEPFLRRKGMKFSEWIVERCISLNITPNKLTMLSFMCAVAAGISFYLSHLILHLLLLASCMIFLNALLDGIDGALARRIGPTPKGDFLDHVMDRYSDVAIFLGIIFGGFCSAEVGLISIIGILLTSYLGTQAQAVGFGRYYGGLLGRCDRLILCFLSSILNFIYPHRILYFPVLGWFMVLIAILSNFTALQRFVHLWRNL